MFRTTKKKPPPSRKVVRLSTASDDSDDDENDNHDGSDGGDDLLPSSSPSVLAMKKRKLKRRGPTGLVVVRSFDMASGDVDENENDNNDGNNDNDADADADKKNKKKKKKRRRGLGFGGGMNSNMNGDYNDDDDVDVSPDEGTDMNDRMDSAPSYGKEALEQLKSEQKLKSSQIPFVEREEDVMTNNVQHLDTPPIILTSTTMEDPDPEKDVSSTSYIPLGGAGEDYVDETVKNTYIPDNMADDNDIYDPMDQQSSHILPSEETDVWEEEIERRAGIKEKMSSSTIYGKRSTTTKHPKLISLEELREKLQSTMKSIEDQLEELENSTNRRRADSDHARAECQIQEENLKSTGEAFEFYQSLRQDLTLWVGALRDLQRKVRPVLDAFRDMLVNHNVDASMNFTTFQDDCIATLQEQGYLSRVVGRQPCIPTTDGASNIDEFGRDIRSQYRRDRDVRFKTCISKLRIALAEKEEEGQSTTVLRCHHSKLLLRTMYDDHNEKVRCETLHEAINSTVQDLDQHFTSIMELKRIFFDRWRVAYSDDFRQSFASLSYADLSAILLQLELCKSTWFHDMMMILPESTTNLSSNDALKPFFLTAFEGDSNSNSDGMEETVGRTLEKACIPMIVDVLLKAPSFLFLSSQKSRAMTNFLELVFTHLKYSSSSTSHHIRILQNSISKAIVQSLDDLAIPILERRAGEARRDRLSMDNNVSNEEANIELAFKFGTSYLVQIIQDMLCNIVLHWFKFLPIIVDQQENNNENNAGGIESVFNFVNDKFLMLLSSVVDTKVAGDAFRALWKALNDDPRKPLEEPSFMLMTMPLRAAAQVYQISLGQ